MTTEVDITTGASSGIGKAIYDHLRSHWGREVVGISRRGPDISADFRVTQANEVLAQLHTLYGPDVIVRTLVNCAGILHIPEREQRHIMGVNFWAPYELTRALEPLMQRGSCIINIGSLSGIRHEQDFPVYSASKAALHSLTASEAIRLAPKGIRVNAISPGFFQTNLVEGDTPQELIDRIPLRREAKPEEILPVVQAIINSHYMTGSNIVIDGGLQWA